MVAAGLFAAGGANQQATFRAALPTQLCMCLDPYFMQSQ